MNKGELTTEISLQSIDAKLDLLFSSIQDVNSSLNKRIDALESKVDEGFVDMKKWVEEHVEEKILELSVTINKSFMYIESKIRDIEKQL